MDRVLIYEQVDQVLEHLPRRPVASATWVLEDLRLGIGDPDRVLDSGAAIVNLAELTTDEIAGYSATSATTISVATTTGAEQGPAWLEAEDGRAELVEIDGWVPDDYLRAKRPIVGDYETGAKVRWITIRAPIADAVAARDDLIGRDLRIVWTYDDGGPIVAQDYVAIRRVSAGDGTVNGAIVFAGALFPELNDQIRSNGNELDSFAAQARRRLSNQLRADDIEPTEILAGPRAAELLGLQLLLVLAANGIHPSASTPERWMEFVAPDYQRVYDKLTVGSPGKAAAETDEGGQLESKPQRAILSFGL